MRHHRYKFYRRLSADTRALLDELARLGRDPYDELSNDDGQLAVFLVCCGYKLRKATLSLRKTDELISHASIEYIAHLKRNFGSWDIRTNMRSCRHMHNLKNHPEGGFLDWLGRWQKREKPLSI